MGSREIKVVADLEALVEEAAYRIALAAEAAIAAGGSFSLVLSGGGTPKPVYQQLAREPYRSRIDWSRTHVYFGDERCVGPESEQSNYHMARAALLGVVPIPQSQVHRIRGEIEPEQAAIEYGRLLKEQFGDGGPDLVLLGMGGDGHTASLFPQTAALRENKHRCVANRVEKLKTWRITMTAPFINRAGAVIFMVSGADKSKRLLEVLKGPYAPEHLPSQLIRPTTGGLTWLLDAAAAGELCD